jgi:hypothetical protein
MRDEVVIATAADHIARFVLQFGWELAKYAYQFPSLEHRIVVTVSSKDKLVCTIRFVTQDAVGVSFTVQGERDGYAGWLSARSDVLLEQIEYTLLGIERLTAESSWEVFLRVPNSLHPET